ncbi:MAG: cobalt-precorrin 5A hydrolase [Spirochaetes bacterium]|nr:cobalt-precorrin 5A hydrolase [Spirochaetota bacterium]
MRIAVITLTKGGLTLAEKMKESFPESVIHSKEKNGVADIYIKGNFTEHIGSIFNKYDVLVFIMASGIVVRSIAPYIREKTSDPAVLVMDEKGKFVISLLSGHIGGANHMALEISERLGAEPVITTSSDVNGLISVDMIAKQLGCVIDDMQRAKDITSLIVNGAKVAIVSDINIALHCLSFFTDNTRNKAEGLIYLTNKTIEFSGKPYVQLIPVNIIAGIGCRKGTQEKLIYELIIDRVNHAGLDLRSIKGFASINIKKNETGLLNAVSSFGKKISFFSADEINKVENRFAVSDFVRENTGAGAVAEPCAFLASDGSGKLLMSKYKENGITIALWEEEINCKT